MDKKDFTIGLLTTTAMILLVGVVIIHTRHATVFADGMSATGGDYILTVGAFEETDEEYVFVLDKPTDKMIIYRYDSRRRQINIVQGIDLAEVLADQPNSSKQRRP